MATTVRDLVGAMEAIAPTRFAAEWDNVGLLVGDPSIPASRVMLAIDCTRAVVDEAARERCDAIVSYHPPIFAAQKRFVAGSAAYHAAHAGIAVFSPHTALDVAEGGTNDVLADAIGMTGRAPLRPLQALTQLDVEYKLVTFVPAEHVDAVSEAVFAAGAGRIGKYTSCSFRAPGTGTFFGESGANPAVGKAGVLEHAPEVRLETVVPVGRADAVAEALRRAHPYEEPAFDWVRLAPAGRRCGLGRVGAVDGPTVRALVDRAKRSLGVAHALVAGDLDAPVTRAAVCAGSGGDLVPDAIAGGAQLLLTGEVRHHDALRAVDAGLAVACVRHSTSERGALAALQRRLSEHMPAVTFVASREDREPFSFA
jgi:dinuclear metal center YbgI/SA1388 family protein